MDKAIEFHTLKPAEDTPPPSPAVDVSKANEEAARHRISKRAAKEIKDGFYVNLGVGMPTLVPGYLPPGTRVWLQSENGILGAYDASI